MDLPIRNIQPDLFQEIEKAKIQGHYKKYMKKLSKVDLLILDEFLLTTISECEQDDLFEVIQSKTDKNQPFTVVNRLLKAV